VCVSVYDMIAADDCELSEHQSSECTERCHQSDGVRLTGVSGRDAADHAAKYAAFDADSALVHAVRRAR